MQPLLPFLRGTIHALMVPWVKVLSFLLKEEGFKGSQVNGVLGSLNVRKTPIGHISQVLPWPSPLCCGRFWEIEDKLGNTFSKRARHLGKSRLGLTCNNIAISPFIKFSTSDNAFLAFWLVHSISVISSYTLVWPYMESKKNLCQTKQRKEVDFASFLPTKQKGKKRKCHTATGKKAQTLVWNYINNKLYLKNFQNGLQVLAVVSF